MLVALAACGKPAATTAPATSPTPSDSPTGESTFTPLPRATHPDRPTTPPDSFVAFTDAGDIVVAETATGQIVRKVVAAADLPGAVDALSVAPGGRILYYSTTIGHEGCAVWTVPLAGGTPKRIATGGAPAVSPDGKWLAFVRPRCGQSKTTLTIREISSGQDRTWDDTAELPADAALDWSPDSKTLYLMQCGADTCGPVAVDPQQPPEPLRKRYVQPEDLDGRAFGWSWPVTRGSQFVTTVDYGDVGGDERYPMVQIDPATGRIVATLYDDGREFRPQDFDRSGQHMLILRGDTLNRWSAGNLFPLGDGFVTTRWIE